MPGRTADDVLEHFGIKGMRWGVRRSEAQLRRARGDSRESDSDDSKTASELKKRPLASLSNAELKQLNERMQLEQTYSQLTTKQSTINQGKTRFENTLNLAKKLSEVYNLVNSPGARAARMLIDPKYAAKVRAAEEAKKGR